MVFGGALGLICVPGGVVQKMHGAHPSSLTCTIGKNCVVFYPNKSNVSQMHHHGCDTCVVPMVSAKAFDLTNNLNVVRFGDSY